MGHNFFFAYTVVVGMHVPWRIALGGSLVVGATLGTSTVTAYIESSTGVSAGGRTGWRTS
jgi:xanthine/uracil/vitamin C permease (AzgA family)